MGLILSNHSEVQGAGLGGALSGNVNFSSTYGYISNFVLSNYWSVLGLDTRDNTHISRPLHTYSAKTSRISIADVQ